MYITNLDNPYHNVNTLPKIDIELVKTEQPDTPAHMSLILKGRSKKELEEMVNKHPSGISPNVWSIDEYEIVRYIYPRPIYRATRRFEPDVDTERYPRLAKWIIDRLDTLLQRTRERITKEKSGDRDETALEAELAVFQRFLGATRGQTSVAEVKTEQPQTKKESVRRDSLAVAEEVRQDIGARMPGSVKIARLLEWDSVKQSSEEPQILQEWDEAMLILGSEAIRILIPLRRINTYNSSLTDPSGGLLTVDSIRTLKKKGLLDLHIKNLHGRSADVLTTLFAPIEESQ